MKRTLIIFIMFCAICVAEPQKGQRLDIDLNITMETEVKFDNEFKDYLNEYFLINED